MGLRIEPAPRPLPDAAAFRPWQAIPTAIASDELNRSGAMAAAIKPLRDGSRIAGPALTVETMVGDNAALHYAVRDAWPGAVIVADAGGYTDTAVWGGILHLAASTRGVGGVVIDGAVRDSAELRQSSVPIFARAIVPAGPHKGFGGAVNSPTQCGGCLVRPGDLILGDDDGVVVVPHERAEAILARCRKRLVKEEDATSRIARGESTVDLLGLPGPDEFG